MIDLINRVRRLSVQEDWPSCDYCREEFSAGFTFFLDIEHGICTLSVCDDCLAKTKRAKLGWRKQQQKGKE